MNLPEYEHAILYKTYLSQFLLLTCCINVRHICNYNRQFFCKFRNL